MKMNAYFAQITILRQILKKNNDIWLRFYMNNGDLKFQK